MTPEQYKEQYNTRANVMKDRKEFVENIGTSLSAFQDFEAIRFAWSIKDEAEYVRIQDSINNDVFLRVDGLTKAEIFKEVCKVVLAGDVPECVPDRILTNNDEKRAILPLFNKEGQA